MHLPEKYDEYASVETYISHLKKVAETFFDGDVSRKVFFTEMQNFAEELFIIKGMINTFCEIMALQKEISIAEISKKYADFTIQRTENLSLIVNEAKYELGNFSEDYFTSYSLGNFEFFDEVKNFVKLLESCTDLSLLKKEICKLGTGLLFMDNELSVLKKVFGNDFDNFVLFTEDGFEILERVRERNLQKAYLYIDTLFEKRIH